ncbi:MAG: hypothetical protein JW709_14225 [Sedimentisphaerales bacterium]|nr:hypothetical protein [Sedimentisphaerales bacterium]
MKTSRIRDRGGSSVLAIFFVCLFAVLATSFVSISNLNVQVSNSHQQVSTAHAAAQSGLAYAHSIFTTYIQDEATKTFINTVSESEAEDTFTNFATFVQTNLDLSPVLGGGTVVYQSSETQASLTLPTVIFDNQNIARIKLVFEQDLADPHTILVRSTGSDSEVTRTVVISYTIKKDNSLLKYAVASKSPVYINGDSTINGDILSTWENVATSPPLILSPESTVNGTLGTTLSEDEFPAELIEGANEGIEYDQPDFDVPDFDSSYLLEELGDKLKNLPASGITQPEYFPHGPLGYFQPLNASSILFNRHVYEAKIYNDSLKVAAGRNALFRNCTFNGVTFIDVSGNGTNNIRFENCTFNGPVITGVPPDSSFFWKLNTLYFTGHTVFNHGITYETTVLAPNFNVNFGNTNGTDTTEGVTGLVVGGVVDVRGNVNVDGSIVSMYDTSTLSETFHATNVGYADDWEGTVPMLDGTINIQPDPSRLLPSGVSSKIIFERNSDQYVEL